MKRLFVAIDLPEAIKTQLKALCVGLAGAKWVSYPQMHLTLRFIGDTDAEQQVKIETGLATVRATPFKMALKGIGQFPTRGKARVLWVGIDADEALYTLPKQIEPIITGIGFGPADHDFSPHITLARFKTPPTPEVIQRYFNQHQGFGTEPFEVDQFILYSSQLTPSGSIYRQEGVFKLG